MASKILITNGKYVDDQMGNGVPKGGITGQILTKASNTDYDVVWGSGGGGGGTVTGVTGTSPIVSSGGNTPAISIPLGTSSADGYLSATDRTNFQTAYTNRITSLTTTGTGAATLVSNVLNIPTPPAATFTSLTVTGNSGASTLLSGVLNIPTYTLSGLGGQSQLNGTGFVKASGTTISYDNSVYTPTSRNLTINGTTYDLSADRTWTIPTFNTPLTTKGDIYVRNASADTRLPVGLDTQMLIADSSTTTGLKWTAQPAATPTGYYGAWQDNNTQTAAASNVGYAMIFRTVDLSNGVTVVTDGTNLTRITFANTGIYNLQFSSQFQNSNNQLADVTIWLRLNGADVAGSSGFVSVPNSHGGTDGHVVVSWNYLLSVVAGEYYELVWSTTDHTHVTMQFYAAGSPPPSAASVILTVTQQSGIMAGTGITAINSLTGAAQTLGVGTSGTDFAISSSGTSHTFNLPTASSTNRGALSSTDWTTFNSKQNALTNPVTGTGTNNQLAYFNTTGSTIASLTTATYPSLTELSYVKGVTSALQTQLAAKQDLSLSAYSFRANNTNATANAADATYRDAGLQTYTGTATWTGTTAPSGTTNHSYYWNQVGKLVTLRINLSYTVAGNALTIVSMTLPTDCPTPASPSGVTAANEVISYGAGALSSAKTFVTFATIGATIAGLRRNNANTGYEVVVTRASSSWQYAYATIQYFTA